MKSKTLIEKQLRRKMNPEVVKTIINAKKKENWMDVANLLSRPKRKQVVVNLDRIENESKKGDIVVIPGKVLSQGRVNKKLKVVAMKFSGRAREKLKEKNCDISKINEEIEKNPKAKGVKILK